MIETCQIGANMWKASAMSSRSAISNWAPRKRKTRMLTNPSKPAVGLLLGCVVPTVDGGGAARVVEEVKPALDELGDGSQRMMSDESKVIAAESKRACLKDKRDGDSICGVGSTLK